MKKFFKKDKSAYLAKIINIIKGMISMYYVKLGLNCCVEFINEKLNYLNIQKHQ